MLHQHYFVHRKLPALIYNNVSYCNPPIHISTMKKNFLFLEKKLSSLQRQTEKCAWNQWGVYSHRFWETREYIL